MIVWSFFFFLFTNEKCFTGMFLLDLAYIDISLSSYYACILIRNDIFTAQLLMAVSTCLPNYLYVFIDRLWEDSRFLE